MQKLRLWRRCLVVSVLAGGFAMSAIAVAGPPAKVTAETAKAVKAAAPATKTAKALGVEMTVRSFQLDNGLRVFVLEDHSTPAFSIHLAFDVGSRDEEPGKTGFAHLFEHLMFKGSKNVPDGGHYAHVLGAGGQMNAFTTHDVTQYFNVLPSGYLDQILWLEADRMRSLEVTDDTFENQRKAVKEEKAMREENRPYALALTTFFNEVWTGTGYGHSGLGTDADLTAASTQDVKAFFDKYYVPNNAVMAIVGDVSFDDVRSKVEKHFASIPRGADRQPYKPHDHKQSKIEKKIDDKLAQQPLFVIGWKTVPARHEDRHAVQVLMNVLLRGDSSRITKILVDEEKLAVASISLPSFVGGGLDAGLATGAFVPLPGTGIDKIKAVVKAEVAKVRRRGISRKELTKAKNQFTLDTMRRLATNNGRARRIAQGVVFHNDPTHVVTELEKHRNVSAADVKRVANKYLTDDWFVLEIAPSK